MLKSVKPYFREQTLAIAAQKGVVPSNPLEEAVTFSQLGSGKDYLQQHPLSHSQALQLIADHGAVTMRQLAKIQSRFAPTGMAWEESRHLPNDLALAYRLNEKGEIVELAFFTGSQPLDKKWSKTIALHWDPDLKRYRPRSYDVRSRELVEAWFENVHAPLEDVMEQTLVRTALAGRAGRGSDKTSLADLDSYFSRYRLGAVTRWVAILSRLDARFLTANRVHFAVNIGETRGEFSGLQLSVLRDGEEWSPEKHKANYLFEKTNGSWVLRRYKGPASVRLLQWLTPEVATAPLIGEHGNVEISWAELKTMLRNQRARAELFQRLWHRRHPQSPFPKRFIFQFHKDGQDESRIVKSMEILDAVQLPNRRADLGWLYFEHDGIKLRLIFLETDLAQVLAAEILEGDGLIWRHPMEFVLAMRQLGGKFATAYKEEKLTEKALLQYFKHYGSASIPQILDQLHAISPGLPARPRRVAISGLVDHESVLVNSANIWFDDAVNREKVARHYFWVEFQHGGGDDYVPVATSRSTAIQIAEYARRRSTQAVNAAGLVLAPDADEMAQRAKVMRPKPEGFAPIDDKLCKPEPLVTPAELAKVDPLETLPVTLKSNVPGFVPTSLSWKDLATPPTDTIPAQFVDLPEFIGSDVSLPEPPLGMVVAGYAVLGGVVAATGALIVLAPELELISLSLPELAPIPAVAF